MVEKEIRYRMLGKIGFKDNLGFEFEKLGIKWGEED